MKHKLLIIFLTIFSSMLSFASEKDDNIKVSLITCYPGPEVYELYGHTAIRVQQGYSDIVFNYGVFDFNEPNFTYRFVKGSANYILAYYDFNYFLQEYYQRKSKVVEQQLNISQTQAHKILSLLLENARPENREYRYDYIYDNCSTRPRDIIETAIGQSLTYQQAKDNSLSFRDIMRQYNGNYPWQQFGIDLALGSGIDYKISNREQMFAPIYLENAAANATYTDSLSRRVALVANTDVLNTGDDNGNILPPTPWYETPLFVALILFLITATICIKYKAANKITKIYSSVMFTLYAIGGCIIFFLIFVSIHAATSPNYVSLWLNPFYLIPTILIWIKSARKFLYYYQIINFVVLIITALSWWALPQVGNVTFFPLMLIPALLQLNFILTYPKCAKKGK